MDAVNVQSASVIGVSLGSWVAAQVAYNAPRRVKKLIMVAPAGIIVDAEEERRVAEGVRKRRSAAAAIPTWETVRNAMSGLMLDGDDLIDDLIAIRLDIYQDPRMQAAMPRLLAFSLGGQDLSPKQWRSLSQPILSIAAVDAPNMFLRNAYAIAEIVPNARLLEMHGCDHWAQYEQADSFNKLTIEFLKG
ncbi:4,5:9,10-diseco-3-hydroxy-5,9,17-trioxoandrosta-1(10),2-diene-4-oate hydrolase [compost metagenome]